MKTKRDYAKITEYDVYRLLFGLVIDPMVASAGYGLTTKNVASLLDTSCYQANKHLKALEAHGAVGKETFEDICACYEFCECDASGRTYKCWRFKAQLEVYKDQDEKQMQEQKKLWDDFINWRKNNDGD